MSKIVGFKTGKAHTTEIVKAMLKSVGGELVSPSDNFPEADLYIISGILRGTGLMYKECVKRNKNFLFIDHAYFNKGYEHPTWMRITKNRHAFGPVLTNSNSDRYFKYFSKSIEPWRGGQGRNILVFPPTHAISWLFDAHDWEQKIIAEIKQHTDRPIRVRTKPTNPIVDNYGNLLRIENKKDPISLDEDLENAYAAIVYNSNSAIDCLQRGIPVIAGEQCAAYPITHRMEDLEKTLYESNRMQLFFDLAHAQFTILEMSQGKPFADISALL